jgi:hypothetical protein
MAKWGEWVIPGELLGVGVRRNRRIEVGPEYIVYGLQLACSRQIGTDGFW